MVFFTLKQILVVYKKHQNFNPSYKSCTYVLKLYDISLSQV